VVACNHAGCNDHCTLKDVATPSCGSPVEVSALLLLYSVLCLPKKQKRIIE
jgi:hypothetical protein